MINNAPFLTVPIVLSNFPKKLSSPVKCHEA